jgi:clan AA aspartic protease
MIRGQVNARREAIIPLRLRGPNGNEVEIAALLDTGFSASLTLPSATVAELELAQESRGHAFLADGSSCEFDLYGAEVEWNGEWRKILVSALGDEVLLGMRLLADHEVRLVVTPGAEVVITVPQ